MVLQWLIQNSEQYAFRKRDEVQKARVKTAAAFVTSLIADADVVTDWLYFAEIVSRGDSEDDGEDPIPSWIRVLQLVSCICGTLSWLAISSDGRLMDWLRQATWWILWACLLVIYIVLFVLGLFIKLICLCCIDIDVMLIKIENMFDRARDNLNRFFDEGFRISSGGLLMVGILTEDLPQIAVTFLIEDAIGSLYDEKGISRSAYLNLVVAIFDILHKLATAWDDRKLYIPTGKDIRTFFGHANGVWSLTAVGMGRIISASLDGTARLWDIATNKTVQTFNLGGRGWIGSIVALGNDRILTTSLKSDGNMKVFDIESGECLETIDSGDNALKCTIVSNNGDYFLTSKKRSNEIIRWDANTYEQMQTYPRNAHSLVMMDDSRFVSANETRGRGGHPVLWDVDSGAIIRTFRIQKSDSKVTAMSKCDDDSFFVASVYGDDTYIDMFTVGQSDPVKTMTMKGYQVDLLTSVGGDRFVTRKGTDTGNSTADLWDISIGSRLHTFEGHTDSIRDILYLPQQGAIATASDDNTVKVWPIPANLMDDHADDAEGGNEDNSNAGNSPSSSADIEGGMTILIIPPAV